MARVGIIFGLLLCGVTFVGLVETPEKNPAQFFPMMLGIPLLFCGVVALNPHRRKHAMHVASAVALLGAIAGGVRAVYCLFELLGGTDVNLYALKLVLAMTALCAVFVAICVTSFVTLRRRRMAGESAVPGRSINLHQPPGSEAGGRELKSRESA